MTHGHGSKLYDLDSNEYIDYLLNYGPLILGHSPDALKDAVSSQLGKGSAFGDPPMSVTKWEANTSRADSSSILIPVFSRTSRLA